MANPHDVIGLEEPLIGPPLTNPLRENPVFPNRANPPPPARIALPLPTARKPLPPPRGSAFSIEMASAKRQNVATEATRTYFGIVTSRCRTPACYRLLSLEPRAETMVAVPREKVRVRAKDGTSKTRKRIDGFYRAARLRHTEFRFDIRSRIGIVVESLLIPRRRISTKAVRWDHCADIIPCSCREAGLDCGVIDTKGHMTYTKVVNTIQLFVTTNTADQACGVLEGNSITCAQRIRRQR